MPSMITKLKEVPHEVIPAREIEVKTFKLNNFRFAVPLQILARQILAMIESQTNNAKGELVPRDVTAQRLSWESFKRAWEFGKTLNNPPSTAHEHGYKVSLANGVEIQKIPNIKFKIFAMECRHLADIIISSDSAGFSGNIGAQSMADIDAQIVICEAAMDLWLGGGTDNTDTGQAVPIFKHLGTLQPDVDRDYADVREPSADRPQLGYDDAPDLPIQGD